MYTFITVLLLLAGVGSLVFSFFFTGTAYDYDGIDGFFRYIAVKLATLVIGVMLTCYALYYFGFRIITL